MNFNTPIIEVKGIGKKTETLFAKLGVYTIGDILLYFPRTYLTYPKMIEKEELYQANLNEKIALRITVTHKAVSNNRAKIPFTILKENNNLEFIWFHMNYISNMLIPGKQYCFYGKINKTKDGFKMEQPVIYTLEEYKKIQHKWMPVYNLTAGITNNLIIKTLEQILSYDIVKEEHLPEELLQKYELCGYFDAIKEMHFPNNLETLSHARRRFVFEEFFRFIYHMRILKNNHKKQVSPFQIIDEGFVQTCMNKLSYELTEAQKRSIKEIMKDIESGDVMQRLLQGDVGSGKTIVAFLVMALVSKNCYQSAIMVPTEVLARQHYETFLGLIEEFHLDIPVILLTGSLTEKEKSKLREKIELEPNAIIVGTHALIQDKVNYKNLALVITDEQHRFGVMQREVLVEKGNLPHILVMSATPIPRSLAIILYGDMDISVIDEVPKKRLPIKNCVVNTKYRPKAYQFIIDEIMKGHQAYIICPLVEETENYEGENVIDYTKRLKQVFPTEIKVSFLHGKMKNEQKNTIMEEFFQNKIQVLVSTTVVEVGVNVPNATVMLIENAEKFGLAQLHQLRGRVGRGNAQSYCIMMNHSMSKHAKRRLEILNASNDGFFIASEDLKLRGPGDFFGIRQSGELMFRLADIYQDANVLKEASEAVEYVWQAQIYIPIEEFDKIRI